MWIVQPLQIADENGTGIGRFRVVAMSDETGEMRACCTHRHPSIEEAQKCEEAGENAAKITGFPYPDGCTTINDSILDRLGFVYSGIDNETWCRNGVELYFSNLQDCWIIHGLDEAGIEVEFRTIEQLDGFWRACGLPPLRKPHENVAKMMQPDTVARFNDKESFERNNNAFGE